MENDLKFCKYCGEKISMDAVICPKCGRQVEQMKSENSQFVINNVSNSSSSSSASAAAAAIAGRGVRYVNKWVSFILCLLLGFIGGHKFYEGKVGMGILYLFTGGLLCIGWIIDIIAILGKPNPYPVYH